MEFSNLVQQVYEKHSLPKPIIEVVIRSLFDEIKVSLENYESVSIPRFGKFKSVLRKPRKAFNPKTNEPISIPSQVTPTFKPYSELKASVKIKAPFYLNLKKKGKK